MTPCNLVDGWRCFGGKQCSIIWVNKNRRKSNRPHRVASKETIYQSPRSRLPEEHLPDYTESSLRKKIYQTIRSHFQKDYLPDYAKSRLHGVASKTTTCQSTWSHLPEEHLPDYAESCPRRTPTRIHGVTSQKTIYQNTRSLPRRQLLDYTESPPRRPSARLTLSRLPEDHILNIHHLHYLKSHAFLFMLDVFLQAAVTGMRFASRCKT